MGEETLWLLCALLLGLIVGSFLNVVIFRLPVMMVRGWQREARAVLGIENSHAEERLTLACPRSRCGACGAPVRAWQNIPVLSYLLLRGRCASCHTKISVRYPLVELLTGFLFVAVAARYGYSWQAGAGMVFTAMLIVLAFIDADTQLLPDSVTLPLLWLGLLANLYAGFVPLDQAVWGAIAGYSVLWLMFQAFRLLTGKEGMGYGDFKLLAALGAWMGVAVLPVIVFAASLLGIVFALLLSKKREQPMAFGPALALAGWLVFVGNTQVMQLIHWWMSKSGFSV